MYFFTADEHYGHTNIIKYCNRPFNSIEEMDNTLIKNFNSRVTNKDVTIHIGDFCWARHKDDAELYIKALNGSHIFVKGSHDSWLPASAKYIWRKQIEGQFVMCCHYAMRTWERAYYGSWQLYGHSHGKLEPIGLQYDVGVDNNDFYPVSFDDLKNKVFILGGK